MQFFKFIPEAKGTANTAMLKWKNRFFALHEGDMPYELNIDFNNLNISTLSRFNVPNIFSTTAHPVIDKVRNLLYLYGYNNYDFLNGKFIFNIFNDKMEHIFQKNISLINNGMTHDVAFTGDHLIIPDMPLKYDFSRILQEKLPMFFDKEKGITRFGIFDLNTFKDPKWVHLDENIFIFHFSRAIKRAKDFIVYACVMDDLFMEDFVDLENVENEKHVIRGDIRLKEIRIDPDNNNTHINENQYIQNLDVDFYYNLDFPIISKLNPEIIYCTIFDSAAGFIRGYVKIDTSDFKNSKPEMFLFENDMHGNSEPQVVVIDNIEYILTFNNNNENSYISLIDIDNKNINSVKIPTRIPPGFHSIYYDH
jgi:carotenoid cleavage dioxygenase-like enzyme